MKVGLKVMYDITGENEMIKLKECYSEIEETVKQYIVEIISNKSELSFNALEDIMNNYIDNMGYSYTAVKISSPVTSDFTYVQIDTLYNSTRLILGISYNTQELIDNYGGKII